MTWDDEKENFETRPNIGANNKLPADEWNAHVNDQKDHSTRHEDGGSDELDVSGLSGVLADAQTPQTEAVEDIVGALVAGGTNVTVTYDDVNDTLTVDTSALNEEEVEDAVAALVTAGNAITVNYDDANDTLSIAVDESALSFYDGTNLTAPVDNQSVNTKELANVYDYIINPNKDDVATVLNNLSDGDSVWIGVGTHTTTGTYSGGPIIDITANDVTVAGASGSFIKHDSTTTDSGEGVRLIEVRGDDVTLKGFTVDGDYQNAGTIDNATDGHNIAWYGDDGQLEHVRSYFSTGDGVEPFIDSNNGTIVGCHFKENYEQNIHFNTCSDWVATGNVLEGEINNGMVSTYTADGGVTKDCLLANNIIKNGSVSGVQIESGEGEVTGFVSEGNIIRGMAGPAVWIKENSAEDAQPNDITVKDRILGGDMVGVRIATGDGITIGGEITGVAQQAVDFAMARADSSNVTDVEITATIKDCGTSGEFTPAVYLRHEDLSVSDVHIAPEKVVNDAGNQNNAVFASDGGTGSYQDVYVRGGWYDPSHTAIFNLQTSLTAVTDTEPRYATDLSQYGNAQAGTEMWSDGSTGTAGPHKFDGTTWHGFAQASGSTVTP